MPSSPHIDSPILPSFPRRSSVTSIQPTLSFIEEFPQKQISITNSPVMHPLPTHLPNESTSFASNRTTTTNSSTSSPKVSPLLPHERFPSCLSLEHLGFETDDDDDDDWTAGWDIEEARAVDFMNANEHARLLEVGALPEIHEGDFPYYPVPVEMQGQWGDAVSDRSLKLARGRLERTKRRVKRGLGFRMWVKRVLEKIGSRKRW